MARRRQMLDPLDIFGPVDVVGILRPGDDKAAVRQQAGGFQQQRLKRRLPVGAVGAEIAQIPSLLHVHRTIAIRVDGAIQRLGPARAALLSRCSSTAPPENEK